MGLGQGQNWLTCGRDFTFTFPAKGHRAWLVMCPRVAGSLGDV